MSVACSTTGMTETVFDVLALVSQQLLFRHIRKLQNPWSLLSRALQHVPIPTTAVDQYTI
jgi:hypothetical protein